MATIVEESVQVAQPRYRWTTAEFDRLVAEGFIREGSRVFLWDGEIIQPMPEDAIHSDACENLVDLLKARLAVDAWAVNSGRPIALSDGFLPQPDVTVLRGPRSDRRGRRVVAADVNLVVEVANSSYATDAGPYLRLYALEGIPIYWIVNTKARRVEVYSRPDRRAGRYDLQSSFGLGQAVPLTLEDIAFEPVPVESLLRDSIEG